VTDGTNGTAAQAVSTMLAAANAFTCVGGSNAGAYCNNYICQTTGSLCCSNPGICSPNQAFANFYVQDEPGEACLPALRTIGKYLALYDPSHSGISNFSTLFSDPDAQPYPHNSYYRSMLFDKVLGYDQVMHGDQYPFWNATPDGDVYALEYWAGRIDDHYMLAPDDKPLYYIMQAHHDG